MSVPVLRRTLGTYLWTLLQSVSEKDDANGCTNLVLVHFDTPHLNIRQREPNILFLQNALLSSSQNGLSVFHSTRV